MPHHSQESSFERQWHMKMGIQGVHNGGEMEEETYSVC